MTYGGLITQFSLFRIFLGWVYAPSKVTAFYFLKFFLFSFISRIQKDRGSNVISVKIISPSSLIIGITFTKFTKASWFIFINARCVLNNYNNFIKNTIAVCSCYVLKYYVPSIVGIRHVALIQEINVWRCRLKILANKLAWRHRLPRLVQ